MIGRVKLKGENWNSRSSLHLNSAFQLALTINPQYSRSVIEGKLKP